MVNIRNIGNRFRWPLITLTCVTGVGVTVGGLRLRALIQDQLPNILRSRLETALGHRIEFGELTVLPTGVWVNDLRVLRNEQETVDPLFARRVGASLDWWQLLTERRVRITGVDVVDGKVRLSPVVDADNREPWTAQLLSLSRSGVERFRVRNTSVEMLGGNSGAWAARGVTGDLVVRPEEFLYQLRLASLAAAGTEITGLRLEGTGDAKGVRLARSLAEYAGGRFEATGTVAAEKNAADLKVRVQRLPLQRLASQLGIPMEWAMKGTVTGEVTVGAHDNVLRAVRGKLHLNRGSFTRDGGVFPWSSAVARVDWNPERTSLQDVRVRGNGLDLRLTGQVDLANGQPFTAGKFLANGQLIASRREAVTQIAELLAFRKALDGRWNADRASIRFQAHGIVGELAQAAATGKIEVEGLKLRPTPNSDQVLVKQLVADLDRNAERLALTNLRLRTDGVSVDGGLTLKDDQPGGTFAARGRATIHDLKALKKAVPEVSLWKWVPSVSSSATAEVDFNVGGPAANLAQWKSRGRFELRNFRLGARSPLPNKAMFFIPVNTAAGEFRHSGAQVDLVGLRLDTPSFQASGEVGLGFHGPDPAFHTALRILTDDWRALPAMPVGALPGLEGGKFEAEVHLSGLYSRLSEVPVEGSFRLLDATYAVGPEATEGAENAQAMPPIPVRELASRFRWARPEGATRSELSIESLNLDTPVFTAEATGRAVPSPERYELALDIEGRTENAGGLAARLAPELKLSGGSADVRVQLTSPLDGSESPVVAGTLALKDGRLHHAAPVLGVTAAEGLEARELTVDFRQEGQAWTVNRAVLSAPGIAAQLEGSFADGRIDADLDARVANWSAPDTLPVAGGSVALKGRLAGLLAEPENLTYNGTLSLAGAQARYAAKNVSVTGGRLNLNALGEGRVGDGLEWLRSGTVELAGVRTALGGKEPQTLNVSLAPTPFRREGSGFAWENARLSAGTLSATLGGKWNPDNHRVTVQSRVRDLSELGISLPQGLSAAEYVVDATVEGDAKELVRKADGTVALAGVRFAPQGGPAQALDRVSGELKYADGGLRFTKVKGEGPAGVLAASGEWSKSRRQIAITLAGEDFSRLGYALPEGFKINGYRLQADVTGTNQSPLAQATGTLQVKGAEFPFGPGQAHRVETASTKIAFDGKRVTLSDLVLDGAVGRFTGTGEVAGGNYRLALASDAANGDLVRWLIPGKMEGGHLSGTVVLEGNGKQPVDQVSGRFVVKNATYTLPKELGLLGSPAKVEQLAGSYQWKDGRTTLTGLTLASDLGSGTGTLTVVDAHGEVSAELKTADAGRISDFWPALLGRLQGGAGEGSLRATFDKTGIRGTIALRAQGGVAVLPGAPAEYAEHPIETASMLLGFEPGKLTFTDVKMRGPKGNVDGSGAWADGGTVFGKGKAWFSKSYTSKLIKPSGWGWLAKLVGIREIKSSFTVSGTSDRVMLNAGITKGLMWKVAKGRVPKEFQKIAAGKSPLWVAPEEDGTAVAATTAPSTIAPVEKAPKGEGKPAPASPVREMPTPAVPSSGKPQPQVVPAAAAMKPEAPETAGASPAEPVQETEADTEVAAELIPSL